MLFLIIWFCSTVWHWVLHLALFFLLRIALIIWDLSCLRIFFSISEKNVIGILIGITFNL
jgi:hypothetical protein